MGKVVSGRCVSMFVRGLTVVVEGSEFPSHGFGVLVLLFCVVMVVGGVS